MTTELAPQAETAVHALLDHFMPGRWKDVAPGMASVTDTGVCYMYTDEVSLKAGFGAVSGLAATTDLLVKLVEINARNRLAHAWLYPENGGETWSLLVTFKLAYAWTAPHEMNQFMYTVLTNQRMVLDIVHELVLPLGGRRYWDPSGGMRQVDEIGYKLAAELTG